VVGLDGTGDSEDSLLARKPLKNALERMAISLNPKDVYFGCVRCDTRLELGLIKQGQWIAEYPNRSSSHVGFHISQMMTHSPEELYNHFIDPKTKIYEFYRKRLGIPYELGIGSLEREDVLSSCFDEPYDFEKEPDGTSTYYMGVDQGNELQVLIGKVPSKEDKPKIVHMELIPYDQGGFKRVGQLMHLFKIKRAILDADPNRHSARDLLQSFPGRMLLADYSETRVDWQTKINPKTGITDSVVIGRSEGFDSLITSIREREWLLPGFFPNLHRDTELIIDHITALRRDLETRNTPSGEREVPVWRELRPSHLAHAWLYLKTAIETVKGKNFRVAVVNRSEKNEDRGLLADGFSKAVLSGITYYLAEVPTDQLKEFLKTGAEDKMPLQHKLSSARKDGFTEDEIKYVAVRLLLDRG